jgi:hypothetical protein
MVSAAFAGFAEGFSNVYSKHLQEQGAINKEKEKYSDILINSITLPEDVTPERRIEYKQLLMQQHPELLKAFVGRQLVNGDQFSITQGPYQQGTGYRLGSNSTLNLIKATTSTVEREPQRTRRILADFNIQIDTLLSNNQTMKDQDAIRQVFNSMSQNHRNTIIKTGIHNDEYEARKAVAANRRFLVTQQIGMEKKVYPELSNEGKIYLKDHYDRELLPRNPQTNAQYNPNADTIHYKLIEYLLYHDKDPDSVPNRFISYIGNISRDNVSPALLKHLEKFNAEVESAGQDKQEAFDASQIFLPASTDPDIRDDQAIPSNITEGISNYLVKVEQTGYSQNLVPKIVNDINSVSSNITHDKYIGYVAIEMLKRANIEPSSNKYNVYYDMIVDQLLRAYRNR